MLLELHILKYLVWATSVKKIIVHLMTSFTYVLQCSLDYLKNCHSFWLVIKSLEFVIKMQLSIFIILSIIYFIYFNPTYSLFACTYLIAYLVNKGNSLQQWHEFTCHMVQLCMQSANVCVHMQYIMCNFDI